MACSPTLSVWLVLLGFGRLRLLGARNVAVFRFFHPAHRVFEVFERFAEGVAQFRKPAWAENQKDDSQNEKMLSGDSEHAKFI